MTTQQRREDATVETVPRQPFAHLSAPNAPLYRDVLMTFARARARFIVHMRPEDVIADLGCPGETDEVVAALDKLVEWGNLRADPDTSRVTSVEDFHRARYLYQLTTAGEAAEQAIAVYEEAIGRRGSLQSVALADIAAQLRSLADMADRQADPDPAKVHLLLLGLAERFAGLADNAQAFMASLRRVIDFADGDVDAFVAYKQRLIDYINRFIADLANRGAEIATVLARIESAGVERLLLVAARREAADAVPDLPEDEPGNQEPADAYDDPVVYYDELTDDERGYLVSQRHAASTPFVKVGTRGRATDSTTARCGHQLRSRHSSRWGVGRRGWSRRRGRGRTTCRPAACRSCATSRR